MQSASLSYNPQYIDISSSSWGPLDDGITMEGPGELTQRAFVNGVENGRGGLGSIYVWAAGNGGSKDNCNCDGYANSIYTIAIGSTDSIETSPSYSEPCSATMV